MASSLALPVAGSGTRHYDVDVQVTPPSAALLLDGQEVGVGRYVARLPQDGRSHELRALANGYLTRSLNFRDEPPPSQISLTPSMPDPASEPVAKAPAPRSSSSSQARPRTSARIKGAGAESNQPEGLPATVPHIAVIEQQRPKVRIVDELEPRVRVIE
jgi:hypothetical protein